MPDLRRPVVLGQKVSVRAWLGYIARQITGRLTGRPVPPR